MSHITPFNFNFTNFPSTTGGGATFPAGTSGLVYPNRFSSSTSFQFQNHNPNGNRQDLQIPESIAQNYEASQPQQPSYTDYYGNPTQSSPRIDPLLQNVDDSSQPAPQPQPQRKRRPKANRLNRNLQHQQQQQPAPKSASAPALSYGPHHVQTLQQFSQQHNPSNPHGYSAIHYTPVEARVTPIQGPIYAKDGLLPVVPLYSYDAVKNGTLYQIPILWTALSYALGLELRGEILRGLPCIKRLNQLFCPTAGNTYPVDHIEKFIDENKALIKRMYGEFVMNSDPSGGPPSSSSNNLRRSAREVYEDEVAEFFGHANSKQPSNNPSKLHFTHSLKKDPGLETVAGDEDVDIDAEDDEGVLTAGSNNTESGGGRPRKVRQTVNPRNGGPTQQPKSNRVDSCESTTEITTPYWAANSAGKVRAIVNTQHFEQAIQQEVCTKTSTKRCTGDCGCEQKYKWHRLLAYDPDNDCRGIFMDWFLFPSCCVCRCNP